MAGKTIHRGPAPQFLPPMGDGPIMSDYFRRFLTDLKRYLQSTWAEGSSVYNVRSIASSSGATFKIMYGTDVPVADPGTDFALYVRTAFTVPELYLWNGAAWFPLQFSSPSGGGGFI